jgi:hypothetical protein
MRIEARLTRLSNSIDHGVGSPWVWKLMFQQYLGWAEDMCELFHTAENFRAAGAVLVPAGGARAQFPITCNDEKVPVDQTTGKIVTHQPGKDTVSSIDIADPVKPRTVRISSWWTLSPGRRSIGDHPAQHLALVSNSLDWVKDPGWKGVPDNKIYVIDLTASPPAQIATIEVGKQASTMAINRAGTLARVANCAEDSVTVLAITARALRLSARGRHSARCIGRPAAPGAPRCRCDHAWR